MDSLDAILKVEQGECESREELADAVQVVIDSGLVWSLQGFWGRLARDLINAGDCHLKGSNHE